MVKVELTPEECDFICSAAFYTIRNKEVIEMRENELAELEREKETALPRRTKTIDKDIKSIKHSIKWQEDELKVKNSLMEKLKDHTTRDERWS